jgi:hypothetical protein
MTHQDAMRTTSEGSEKDVKSFPQSHSFFSVPLLGIILIGCSDAKTCEKIHISFFQASQLNHF